MKKNIQTTFNPWRFGLGINCFRWFPSILCVCLLGSFVLGCRGTPAGSSRWGGSDFGQGSIERQKARAVTFDPFPLNDIGPPIVGGRPREFANPMPEPHRNELTARPVSPWAGYRGY